MEKATPLEKTEKGLERVCPVVGKAFNLLGRKWAGLVVHALAGGPRHFCELERGIPEVSARMLAERVRELEGAGIVTRTVHTGTPVRVVYELTEKGRQLVPIMQGIERWARAWEQT